LGNLLDTTSEFKSAAEVSRQIARVAPDGNAKALILKSKGKAPARSPAGDRMPALSIDTRSLTTHGPKQSYGAISDQRPNGAPSIAHGQSPETYRNSHPLFDVPEEVDDEDLEALLDEEGLYLGPLSSLDGSTSLI
jgi:hypothetical protein